MPWPPTAACEVQRALGSAEETPVLGLMTPPRTVVASSKAVCGDHDSKSIVSCISHRRCGRHAFTSGLSAWEATQLCTCGRIRVKVARCELQERYSFSIPIKMLRKKSSRVSSFFLTHTNKPDADIFRWCLGRRFGSCQTHTPRKLIHCFALKRQISSKVLFFKIVYP